MGFWEDYADAVAGPAVDQESHLAKAKAYTAQPHCGVWSCEGQGEAGSAEEFWGGRNGLEQPRLPFPLLTGSR